MDRSSSLSEALRLFSAVWLVVQCGALLVPYRLPRHRDSRDLKGFAYVTFSNPGEALKALKVRGVGSVTCDQCRCLQWRCPMGLLWLLCE